MIIHNNETESAIDNNKSITSNNINHIKNNNDKWKICTINVCGINDPSKLYILNDWIQHQNLDFTFLTETKLSKHNTPKFNLENTSLTAFYESSITHTLGQGVAIIMKNEWARHVEEINKLEGRLLHLVLKFKGKKTLHLICCYGPASKQISTNPTRQKLTKYIEKIIIKNESIIVAGDFNEDCILYNNNTSKCPITTNIINHGLINTHDISLFPNTRTFTWQANNIFRTLDYIFIDPTLATQYTPLTIPLIESNFSDHYPIGIV